MSYSHQHEMDIVRSAGFGPAMEVRAVRLWRNCAMGLLKYPHHLVWEALVEAYLHWAFQLVYDFLDAVSEGAAVVQDSHQAFAALGIADVP